jgi:trimethylamine--corrinoid protein Co-methyltransferase
MVSRILRGIEVNEETLAVDEICKYGHTNYLGSPYTRSTFRREHYLPTLFDRKQWEAWLKAGSKDISLDARRKAQWILKEHHPEPIDRDIQADIDEFIKKTTRGVQVDSATVS